MIQKTKDYTIFKFRDDNREKIDEYHVKKLMSSIQSKNLLEFRPILVNSKFEVMDGQHRLIAAKNLGLEIFYEVNLKIKPEDISSLNINKSWSSTDFLNFYCKHNFDEYIKLKNFLKTSNVSLSVALTICFGRRRGHYSKFRDGSFKFTIDEENPISDICWDIINMVKTYNSEWRFCESTKFWKSMIRITSHELFDKDRFLANLKKMPERISVRVSEHEYIKMFQEIYNWKHINKVNFIDQRYNEDAI